MANGDEVGGTLEAVREAKVQWQADVGPLRVETSRITALVLAAGHRHGAAQQGFRAWVGLTDGSRLQARRLELDPAQLQRFGVGLFCGHDSTLTDAILDRKLANM